ncbi:hypothetical protein GUITHDRAFT_109215 [Guillardia theta CCMP2712]|uniref:Uncharacterized protein n=1 Tax=Guillardia theta (strain CCMP2712) TaxID=905079 RepID=L1J9N1_GUITC|nr:hypothetical protein GUITHDRAFT_109215 [Guillardia theta CCMP2712]EKX44789.1 hypothetical protein GUITHDRAFT_109215 [Guillardia theta CCMP2712]|eukprot:XP_005831769.1 hypothetical protein GUITHDRAFT_109215 [Guillardia theta CCMP2712]
MDSPNVSVTDDSLDHSKMDRRQKLLLWQQQKAASKKENKGTSVNAAKISSPADIKQGKREGLTVITNKQANQRNSILSSASKAKGSVQSVTPRIQKNKPAEKTVLSVGKTSASKREKTVASAQKTRAAAGTRRAAQKQKSSDENTCLENVMEASQSTNRASLDASAAAEMPETQVDEQSAMEETTVESEIADLNMYLVPADDEEEAMASESEKAEDPNEDLEAEVQQVTKELSASTPKTRRVLQSEDVFTPESDHGTEESNNQTNVAPVNADEVRSNLQGTQISPLANNSTPDNDGRASSDRESSSKRRRSGMMAFTLSASGLTPLSRNSARDRMAEAMQDDHNDLDQDKSNYLRVWKFGDSEIHHLHSPSKDSSQGTAPSSDDSDAAGALSLTGSAAKSISFDNASDRLGTNDEVVLPRTPGSAMRPALSPIPQEEEEDDEAEGRKQSMEGAQENRTVAAVTPGGHRRRTGISGTPMRLSHLVQDTISSSCKKKRARQSQDVAHSSDLNTETSGSIIERAKVRATAAQKEELGTDYVLTPVRRSGRKKSGWSIEDATCIREELMTTGYAYQPNKALSMLDAFDNAKDSPTAEPQEAVASPLPEQTPKRSARKKKEEAPLSSPSDPPRSTRRTSRASTTPGKEVGDPSSIAKKRQQLKAKLAAGLTPASLSLKTDAGLQHLPFTVRESDETATTSLGKCY